MSTESIQGKSKPLLVFLGICALVINGFFLAQSASRQEQNRIEAARVAVAEKAAQENAAAEAARIRVEQKAKKDADDAEAARKEAKRQAEADAAAAKVAREKAEAEEHARFLARYRNGTYSRKPGIEALVLAVASEDGKPNPTVATALAIRLQTNAVEMLSAIVKPEFISDGLINDAFTGSSDLAAKLELVNAVDGFLLARQTVAYSTNPNLLNSLTAAMQLEIAVVSIGADVSARHWMLTASGIGFTKAEARGVAEDHLLKVIANDTKMSLR